MTHRLILLPLALAASAVAYGQIGVLDSACTPASNSSGGPAIATIHGSGNAGCPIYGLISGGPPGKFGYFLSGGVQAPTPVGSGVLCIGGPVYRYNDAALNQLFVFNAAGDSEGLLLGGFSDLPTDGSFGPVPAVVMGESRAFQAWYRDAAPTPTSNFSGSRVVVFGGGSCDGSYPSAGVEGTLVESVDPGFGDFLADGAEPKDVLMVGDEVGGWFGVVDALDSTSALGAPEYIPPVARAMPVKHKKGEGGTVVIPPFLGMTYGDARYIDIPQESADGVSPTAIISANDWTPADRALFGECLEPGDSARMRGYVDSSGAVRFRLPSAGVCAGDTFWFRILFRTQSGREMFISLAASGMASGPPTNLYLLQLVWPIQVILNDATAPNLNLFNVVSAPLTNELVITYDNPTDPDPIVGLHPESCIQLFFDPTQHAQRTVVHGDPDFNPLSPDDTFPDADLQAWALTQAFPRKDYDDPTSDRRLIDTLVIPLEGVDGSVRSARLGLRIRGGEREDKISVGRVGNSWLWSVTLEELATFDNVQLYGAGDHTYLCFDLDEMPLVGGGTMSLLGHLNNLQALDPNDGLDIMFETVTLSNSEVSYSIIHALRCHEQ